MKLADFSYYPLLAAVKILGLLPFALRSRFGELLGHCFALVPTHERRIAQLQIDRFIVRRGDRSHTSDSLVTRCYGQLGATILESMNLTPILESGAASIDFSDWELARGMLDDGRGIVALTAHTGNWDLLAAYMVANRIPISAVGREARNPTLQRLLRDLRGRYQIETIWRADRAGIRAIVERLAVGQVVAALIDQDTRVTSQIVPFFGVAARTPSSLVELALRHNAHLVSAFIVRTSPGRFKIIVEPLTNRENTNTVLREYNLRLERVIKEYPAQWVWMHKRWRTDDSGRRRSSKEYLGWLREAA